MEQNKEIVIDGMAFSTKSVIVTDENIYQLDLLPFDMNNPELEFDEGVAYLDGPYFYVYRGVGNPNVSETLKPGIYKNREESPRFFVVDPTTDEEKEQYDSKSQVVSLNPVSIIDTANNQEDLLIAIPESSKVFQPQITENDDILKLVIKKALLAKAVDLDLHKNRFSNKNELFNLKQVLRGDNTVSIKIFNRAMEALNLEYILVLRERSKTNVVGNVLDRPIAVSSEETYAA